MNYVRRGKDIGDSWRDRYRASEEDMKVLSGLLMAMDFSHPDVVIVRWEHGSVFTLLTAFFIQDPYDPGFYWVFGEHDLPFVVPLDKSFENHVDGARLPKKKEDLLREKLEKKLMELGQKK